MSGVAEEEKLRDKEGHVSHAAASSNNNGQRKKKQQDTDESSVEEVNDSDEESSSEGYDLSEYEFLVGKSHYDPDDDAVYKTTRVAVNTEGDVVVYRSKYSTNTGKWGKENTRDCIHVQDIIGYTEDHANEERMNSILQPRSMVTKKGNRK